MDNQNLNQPMPENSQMPPTPEPKNRIAVNFGGAIILIALIVGGIYLYKNSKVNPPTNTQSQNQVQQNPENTINNNNPTTPTVTCGNFSELSDYISKTIQSPDNQSVMQMNPYVITSFRWQRNTSEPFITYPIINGVQAVYGDQNNFRSNDFITSAIENDSKLISQSINEKAKELGFAVDSLNTLPLKTFSNKDILQVFAFKKGDSIYDIVLKSEWGYQAPGRSTVTVTCGKALSDYDKVYNALNLKITPSVENHYNDDYVAISDVSADGKVYALTGNSSQIKIAEYYYFDGDSLKLVSEDNYPTQCAPLESQKVGKGMRCVDPNYNQRTVNY
ncbi:MAG: hypothetical protein HYV76_02630 [Candidatus Vogelbacteria bacterium]|nr:hypothetical protein [Candidatus Vogelbacteria bacterium]